MAVKKKHIKYKKWTQKYIDDLVVRFNKYIDDTDVPIISEFAYKSNINREQLYQHPEISYTIKRCIQKKESSLESLALRGKVNVTMAIFSLKQLGWKDKQEINNKHEIDLKEFAEVIKKNYTLK